VSEIFLLNIIKTC